MLMACYLQPECLLFVRVPRLQSQLHLSTLIQGGKLELQQDVMN